MPSSEEDSGSDSLLTQHSQRFAGDDGDEGEEPTQATKLTQAFKRRRGHGTPRPSATVSRAEHTDEDEEEGEEATQDSPPEATQDSPPEATQHSQPPGRKRTKLTQKPSAAMTEDDGPPPHSPAKKKSVTESFTPVQE